VNATASSQTGCSGLAPAPELCPSGAPAAATSPSAFMNKPPLFPNCYLPPFLLNLTHTTSLGLTSAIEGAESRQTSAASERSITIVADSTETMLFLAGVTGELG
jgi:hypothetical protein